MHFVSVVVRIHANLNPALPNVAEIEQELVTKLFAHLKGQSPQRAESMLRLVALGLIAVRRSGGIVFFFHPKTLKDLVELHDSLVKGMLKGNVSSAFQELLGSADDLGVTLDWKREDYQREKVYFSGESLALTQGNYLTVLCWQQNLLYY